MSNFNNFLQQALANDQDCVIRDAMNYSLSGNGKRIRPKLLFAIMQAYGEDITSSYPCAAAIEMIHTYSLIHDDLPAMDDDKLRRGIPTCHIKYDEATAILAGDALLTKAFEIILLSSTDPKIQVSLVKELATNAGINGMIYGQCLDIKGEKKELSFDEIISIHNYKTAKLITLPLICGAIICKDEASISKWIEFGQKLGILFQVQDDILDVTSSTIELGKEVGRDDELAKSTIVKCIGLEEAKKLAATKYQECISIINKLDIKQEVMIDILDEVYRRVK